MEKTTKKPTGRPKKDDTLELTINRYVQSLEGVERIKVEDFFKIINRSKQFLTPITKEIKDGNLNAVKPYKMLCDLILDCYREMPPDPVVEAEKSGIETAMDILFGKK